MIAALLALWLWDACPAEPVTYRIEYVRRVDAAWQPVLIGETADTQAEVPCDPAPGECCITIVTSIDSAGNLDEGVECS